MTMRQFATWATCFMEMSGDNFQGKHVLQLPHMSG